MSAWIKRFGLHLAAAVGATGIFVAAAAVGASQTRQQVAAVTEVVPVVRTRTPPPQRKPTVVATPTPGPPRPTPTAVPAAPAAPATGGEPTSAPAADKVVPERSLAGTIKDVLPDGLDVLGVGGREWHVVPAPGALIRLNGKAAKLDALHPGDSVVILGQAQPGQGARFLAHAITAKTK